MSPLSLPPTVSSSPSSTRMDWSAVTSDHRASFCSLVADRLLPFPNCVSGCSDPLCTQHHALLHEFCEQLSDCLQECALLFLHTFRKSSTAAGWIPVHAY